MTGYRQVHKVECVVFPADHVGFCPTSPAVCVPNDGRLHGIVLGHHSWNCCDAQVERSEPSLRYAVDGAVRSLDAADAAEALLILRAAQRDADAPSKHKRAALDGVPLAKGARR